MNWYSILYWISVLGNFRDILDSCVTGFIVGSCLSLVCVLIFKLVIAISASEYGENSDTAKAFDKYLVPFTAKCTRCFITLTVITTLLVVFLPNKKDSLTILAGGTVGNFIVQDSSARKIPAEAMKLLRDRIREMDSSRKK